MIERLAFGLLATAAFVVVPATAASAWGGVDVTELLPADTCELACDIEQICVGNDENLDGRVCTPFGQSQLVKFLTTAVDENI